jgi:O-methyltransferase
MGIATLRFKILGLNKSLFNYYGVQFIKHIVSRRYRWIKNVYWKFGQEQRNFIFMSIARFLHINRPICGYYFEFGCNEANTMRQAWNSFRHLFDFIYVGFDSFEGLPEISEIDKQDIWKKGKLAFLEGEFRSLVLRAGLPKDKLITVKGFYDVSLTNSLKEKLLPIKAAVIYIDCDLYSSTVPVLEWIRDFLQIGTIIVFDDWFCFNGDPSKGEKRAWFEFRERYPNLKFVEFVKTNEAASFIFIGYDEP